MDKHIVREACMVVSRTCVDARSNASDSIMSPPDWWGAMEDVGVDILKISTLPFSPTDHHANDMRVVALLQKDNSVAT